jgi:hypothetical protein
MIHNATRPGCSECATRPGSVAFGANLRLRVDRGTAPTGHDGRPNPAPAQLALDHAVEGSNPSADAWRPVQGEGVTAGTPGRVFLILWP